MRTSTHCLRSKGYPLREEIPLGFCGCRSLIMAMLYENRELAMIIRIVG